MTGDDPNASETVSQRLGLMQLAQALLGRHRATVCQTRHVLNRRHLVKSEICLARCSGVERDRGAAFLRSQRKVWQHYHVRVGNAVHLGYPARPWLYQPLGRTGPSQSFGKLHDELQGLIPGGERGRAPRGVYAWLRLSVVRLGHRCCDPRGSISPV